MTITLQVEKRDESGKQLRGLRKGGKLPAVVYGPKQESLKITVDKSAFDKMLKEAGESTVINLSGLGGDDIEVLVHDVAFDATKEEVIHADFYAIEKGKKITVRVPLEFIGEAPAVKIGGSVTKVLFELEVTCKPNELPQQIAVDVSSLDAIEKRLLVKDLTVPKGVEVGNDPEEVVVLVQEVVEEPEPEVAPVDMEQVEVEQKGKTEEEAQ